MNGARRNRSVLLTVWLFLACLTTGNAETLLIIEPSQERPRNSEGDIIAFRDGSLCLVYSRFRGGGSDHDTADLAMRTSTDRGRTWSDDEIVVSMDGGRNVMSVSLLRLQSGAIARFYLRKASLEDCRPILQLSTDEMQTWSDPVECITDEIGYYVMNNDRALQLASGRLVLPVALHRRLGEPDADWAGTLMCYLSDDDGKTWRRSKDVRQGRNPAGERETTQEPGVVELNDGRLMMFCRTNGGSQYVAYSGDGGDSWSELQPSNLASPRSPATIERIPSSGKLLCVWNDHSGTHPFPEKKRTPLCLATSSDEGKTWSPSRVIEAYPYGWYCYTSMTFDRDRVLLSYCAGDDEVGGLNRLKVRALDLHEIDAGDQSKLSSSMSPALLMPALDYGRSFINTKAIWNSPRFWIESRCRITDPQTDRTVEYYQCGSCKSEDTFAATDLFLQDNYDFLPVFSAQESVIFRHGLWDKAGYRDVRADNQWWEGHTPRLKHGRSRALRSPREIYQAMEEGQPLVGQTELRDATTGRTAVIEYPIKTINWHRDRKIWQVDTGPVVLPDLSVPPDEWSQTLRLAYIAWNHPEWADFVVMQATPVMRDGKEAARVPHYSGMIHRQTRNVLVALDDE